MPKKTRSVAAQNEQPTEIMVERIVAYISQRQKSLAVLVSLVLAMIMAVVLWYQHQAQQNVAAQNELFQATYYFEVGNYEQALTGDESYAGFLHIIQDYGLTKAANLAHLYAGIAYMHQQNYTAAMHHLKKFKATDFLLQARAWSLLGDACCEEQAYDKAINYYLKAANYKPNAYFTPTYLAKASWAHEANKNYHAAWQCYQTIIDDYPKSPLYEEACKHASRLAALYKNKS